MKFNKMISVLSAAVLAAVPFFGSSVSAEEAEPETEVTVTEVDPVFTEFNTHDVNGSVIVKLPENSSAAIDITAVTPEGSYDYYTGNFNSADTPVLGFDIEGNDDRSYIIGITATLLEKNLTSDIFLGEFSVPDGDFTPDSWKDYIFTLQIEQKDTDDPYTFESDKTTENGVTTVDTVITFYVEEDYLKGDVNEDGKIDALDASLVLTEYALIATQKPTTFTEKQRKAANVNEDATIDAIDASKILTYYAAVATGKTPTWD